VLADATFAPIPKVRNAARNDKLNIFFIIFLLLYFYHSSRQSHFLRERSRFLIPHKVRHLTVQVGCTKIVIDVFSTIWELSTRFATMPFIYTVV
jgi:hypothetical protein